MASEDLAIRDAYESRADRLDDLTLLSTIDNDSISGHLAKRHSEGDMYTAIGDVLVAVNPYDQLTKEGKSVYSPEVAWHFFKTEKVGLAPHIFKVSADAYGHLRDQREDVCVIVTGESGAGKTESAKHIMQFVSIVSPDSESTQFRNNGEQDGGGGADRHVEHVKEQLLNSSPLFEAVGNAKTTRNDNSSRFGKYLELQFDLGGGVVGGRVTSFLLEKSRVVGHADGERGFHVFYQLCSGALTGGAVAAPPRPPVAVEEYRYLESAAKVVAGVDDAAVGAQTFEAMKAVGMSDGDREAVARTLAGILALGNIDFAPNEQGGGSHVVEETRDWLDAAAANLGVIPELLRHSLSTHELSIGGRRNSTNVKLLSAEETKANTDTLAKECYKRLFDLAIVRVNQGTDTTAAVAATTTEGKKKAAHGLKSGRDFLALGVLDIYGFEIFASNGFEQLCINFVNEKLQQLAIALTLKGEQQEYASEGIGWVDVAFTDNLPLVNLIEAPRTGIFAVLDEACTFRGASAASFENAVRKSFALDSGPGGGGGGKAAGGGAGAAQGSNLLSHVPGRRGGEPVFRVQHYAGSVDYLYEGFVEKNEDSLYHDLVDCLAASDVPQIAAMFGGVPSSSSSGAGGEGGGKAAAKQKKKPPSVSQQFKRQVGDLMATLWRCKPHYVRCIKPNAEKKSRVSDPELMLHQVEYLGLTETVKVRRAGFCLRLPHSRFLRRYSLASAHPDVWPLNLGKVSEPDACRLVLTSGLPAPALLKQQKPGEDAAADLSLAEGTDFVVGKTKIFIKAPATVFKLESFRAAVLPALSTSLTRTCRGKLARLAYARDRRSVITAQALTRTVNEKRRYRAELRKVLLVVTIVRGMLSRARVRQTRIQFKNKPPRVYALLVQKRFRGNRGRLGLSQAVREQCAACAFRAKYSKSTRDLQCAFRCALARRTLAKLKADFKGACGVQNVRRSQVARRHLMQHKAARLLQNSFLARKKFALAAAAAAAEAEAKLVVAALTETGLDALKHPTMRQFPKGGTPSLAPTAAPGAPCALGGGGKKGDAAMGGAGGGGGPAGAAATKKSTKAGPAPKKVVLGKADSAAPSSPPPPAHHLSWRSDVYFKSVWGKTTLLPLRSVDKVLVGAQGAHAFAKFGSQDRLDRYVVLVQVSKDPSKAAHFPLEFGSEWSRGRFLRGLAQLAREEGGCTATAPLAPLSALPYPFATARARLASNGGASAGPKPAAAAAAAAAPAPAPAAAPPPPPAVSPPPPPAVSPPPPPPSAPTPVSSSLEGGREAGTGF